jgi:hypothetical protein
MTFTLPIVDPKHINENYSYSKLAYINMVKQVHKNSIKVYASEDSKIPMGYAINTTKSNNYRCMSVDITDQYLESLITLSGEESYCVAMNYMKVKKQNGLLLIDDAKIAYVYLMPKHSLEYRINKRKEEKLKEEELKAEKLKAETLERNRIAAKRLEKEERIRQAKLLASYEVIFDRN